MNWSELTEIAIGLASQGRIPIPNPEQCAPPFDKVALDLREGVTNEVLFTKHGFNVLASAQEKAGRLNGLGEDTNWALLLDESYKRELLASQLEQYEKELRAGKEIDTKYVLNILDEGSRKPDIIKASDVVPENIPLIRSGFPPLDWYVGGFPKAGLVTILAYTGTGKSTLAVKLNDCFLSQYPDKESLFISTEMMAEELTMRANEIGANKKNFSRWNIVEETSRSTSSIYAHMQTHRNRIGIIFVDILDDLVKGEISEPKMSDLYQSLAQLSRKYKLPVIALGQPHRGGGILLKPQNARWSGMAEARSYLFLSLYNPDKSYAKKQEGEITLPKLRSAGYVLVWKCRGGVRPMTINPKQNQEIRDRFPFAFPVEVSSEKGWSNKVREAQLPAPLNQEF